MSSGQTHAQIAPTKTKNVTVQRSTQPFFAPAGPVTGVPGQQPFFAPAFVQAKLTVGPANDHFEREAEAVADRVVQMPGPTASVMPTPGAQVQRKIDDKDREKETVRRQPEPVVRLKVDDEEKKQVRRRAEAAAPALTSGFEGQLSATQTSGQPLGSDVRSYMEPRFGSDFSSVRVHTDSTAVQMSRQIGAQAFTHENHIYFGEGRYQPGSSGGNHLLAHELTHVVQQGAAPQTPTLQRSPTITSAPAPVVQRLFGIDVAGRIDGWLANIPGWRLLTVLVGYNPVLGRDVARTTVNLIEGFLTLGGPLGLLLFNKLQADGVIASAASWIDGQVASLGISFSYVQGLFRQAWDEMGITLGISGNIAIMRRVFGPPFSRMLDFAGRVLGKVVQLLKDTLLRPLSARAKQMRGFPLLTVIIGKDPFTDEDVERSPTNLVRGFMSLMENGEERFQQMQQSGALARAFAWFNTETAKRNLTLARIKATFLAAFNLLTPEAILHPLDTLGQLVGLFGGLVADLIGFAGAALLQMLEFIFEVVMGAGGARVLAVVKRARDTFNVIIRDPVRFVGNLVRAGRLGFQQFMANIGGHLQRGLVGWLLGSMEGAGLQLPQTFDLRGILSLVLQILGITYPNIRAKLVRATSEGFVARLEQVFEFIKILVTQGPAAAWQKILEYVGNLRDMVLDGIKDWVMRTVVGQAVIRIVSMLNPAGAVIQAIMATYNTVMFFIERINQIAAVVESYVDSVAAIAAGNIGAAANRVEQTMGRMVPVIIGFLARLLGLGGISNTIINLIARVRQPVDRALDSVVTWVVAQGRRLVGAVVSAGQQVVGAVLGWLGLRKSFTDTRNESHSLYFTGRDENADLTIASRPRPVLDFLNDVFAADATKRPIVEQAREKVRSVGRIKRDTTLTDAQKQVQMDTELSALAGMLRGLSTDEDFYAPPIPNRKLPTGFDVRNDLYINGSGFGSARTAVASQGKAAIIASLQTMRTNGSEAIWQRLVRDGQVMEVPGEKARYRQLTDAQIASDINGRSYDVDHTEPLAKHWKDAGFNSDDGARQRTAGNSSNLKLMLAFYNRQAGADGHHYADKFYVGPNFTSLYNNSGVGAKKIKRQSFDGTL